MFFTDGLNIDAIYERAAGLSGTVKGSEGGGMQTESTNTGYRAPLAPASGGSGRSRRDVDFERFVEQYGPFVQYLPQ